jgi:hypothetical protein
MNADAVIEMYIDDTVRLLPKAQRNDVAAELRALLKEELDARARESGRSADTTLALTQVRGFGRPNEVAARYHPAPAIIDPADTGTFLRAAIIGTCALLLLSALRKLLPPIPGNAEDYVVLSILAWLGLLVVGFGLKGHVGRNWPNRVQWAPRDPNRVNRIGTAVLMPIAALVVVFYAFPTRVFDLASGGRFDSSWSTYAAEFQRSRLPWFIGCLAGLVLLQSMAAIRGRWTRVTRRIGIGLNLALSLLTLSFAVDGNIFQSAEVDRIARNVLAMVAVIYVPCVGLLVYGEIGRVERPAVARST